MEVMTASRPRTYRGYLNNFIISLNIQKSFGGVDMVPGVVSSWMVLSIRIGKSIMIFYEFERCCHVFRLVVRFFDLVSIR
jgi:hypothetical protein